ncbi:hypothetical protein PFISCL1PPCAC_12619, partial [Pristionchus fissidentatus]
MEKWAPGAPSRLDSSLDAIRQSLKATTSVHVDVMRLETVSAPGRRKMYDDFHTGALESRMKETLGYLPLVNQMDSDSKYIGSVKRFFSNGIEAPGPHFPLFGRYESGVCISDRIDTVHTVVEEGREYWFLVCSVTYNDARLKIVDEVCKDPPERTPQAVRVIVNTVLKGAGTPGWKRHFECLKHMLYVGDIVCTDRFPRNLYPVAVVKVKFRHKDWTSFQRVALFKRLNFEQTSEKSAMSIKKIQLTRGSYIPPMSIEGGIVTYSPYLRRINESQRRKFFCFTEFMSIAEAFNNWIRLGWLDIQALLTEGNVKMPTGVLMGFPDDAEYKGLTSYLNYYSIQVPAARREEMMKLFDVLRSETVILCGETFLPNNRTCIVLAIPPGDQANRLGLPQIPLDHMHIIQALGYPLTMKEPMARHAEPARSARETDEHAMNMRALFIQTHKWISRRKNASPGDVNYHSRPCDPISQPANAADDDSIIYVSSDETHKWISRRKNASPGDVNYHSRPCDPISQPANAADDDSIIYVSSD